MKVLITGSGGFISGYLIQELLEKNYSVIGIDNHSKYGPSTKSYDSHPNFTFVEGDVKNKKLMKDLIEDCDQLIASAAMIGGISYFHEYSYDLIAENERIAAATFDVAIWAYREKILKKIPTIAGLSVKKTKKKNNKQ